MALNTDFRVKDSLFVGNSACFTTQTNAATILSAGVDLLDIFIQDGESGGDGVLTNGTGISNFTFDGLSSTTVSIDSACNTNWNQAYDWCTTNSGTVLSAATYVAVNGTALTDAAAWCTTNGNNVYDTLSAGGSQGQITLTDVGGAPDTITVTSLGRAGSPVFASLSSTGNILVGGTVDGRDIANDGTTIDTLQSLSGDNGLTFTSSTQGTFSATDNEGDITPIDLGLGTNDSPQFINICATGNIDFDGVATGDGSGLTGVTATPIFPTVSASQLDSADKIFINDSATCQTSGNKHITYLNLLTDLAGTGITVESSDSLTIGDSMTSNAVPYWNGSALTDSIITRSASRITIDGDHLVTGDSTIYGNLSVTGDFTCIETTVSTTSALSVSNHGTGPALFVKQSGVQPIAHFIDSNGGDIVFADDGYVGIGTFNPSEKLTVVGNISATNKLIVGVGNIAGGANSSIAGGIGNTAAGACAFIGGGDAGDASGNYSFIGGGSLNTASNTYASVAGGDSNVASCTHSFIGGGWENTSSGDYASIVGGNDNAASGANSFIGGGASNSAAGGCASVVGGEYNTSSGVYSTVIAGNNNTLTAAASASSILAGTNITGTGDDTAYTCHLCALGDTSSGSLSSSGSVTGNALCATGSLTVQGDSNLNSVYVNGDSEFYSDVLFDADVAVSGGANISGNVTLGDAGGDTTTINSTLIEAPNLGTVTGCSLVVRDSGGTLGTDDVTATNRSVIFGTTDLLTGSLSDTKIPVWDGTGSQLGDSSITDDSSLVTIDADTTIAAGHSLSIYATGGSRYSSDETFTATVGTGGTTVATFAKSGFRTGKYIVSLINGVNRTSFEILVTYNDTASFGTVYGIVDAQAASQLQDVNVTNTGSTIDLVITSASATTTAIVHGKAFY